MSLPNVRRESEGTLPFQNPANAFITNSRTHFVFAFEILITATVLWWLTLGIFTGLDLTDEGLYLLSLDKSASVSFHTPFGTPLRILFGLAFEQLWFYRLVGVVLLLTTSYLLCKAAVGHFKVGETNQEIRTATRLISLAIVVLYYGWGLFTPSYNWLNLLGLMLGGLGFLQFVALRGQNEQDRKRKFSRLALSICLIGIGFVVSTFGKLSSGPILLIFGFCFISCVLGFRIALKAFTAILGVTAFLYLSIHILVEPLPSLVEKYARGYRTLTVMDPHYSLQEALQSLTSFFVQLPLALLGQFRLELACILGATFATFALRSIRKKKNRRGSGIVGFGILMEVVVVASFLFSVAQTIVGYPGKFQIQTVLVAASIFAVLAVVAIDNLTVSGRLLKPTGTQLLVMSGLLLLVTAYGFGSNNGFIVSSGGASGLVLLATLVLLSSTDTLQRRNVTLLLSFVVGIILVSVSVNGVNFPYRKPSLLSQTQPLELPKGQGLVLVDSLTARKVTSLKADLHRADWKPGTPMLDYSNFSATLVYLFEGQPPTTVLPSVGGYSGSQALAELSLKEDFNKADGAKWSDAWLITNVNPALTSTAPTFLVSPATVRLVNRVFPDDYIRVGAFADIEIWKPVKK